MSGNCVICGIWRQALHRDHITPKWKARLAGWTKEDIEAPSNKQLICANCHEDKTLEEREDFTPEMKAKMASMTGRHFTSEQKERHRASFTPEVRAKMSASAKARGYNH